jgi:hypothetical protein
VCSAADDLLAGLLLDRPGFRGMTTTPASLCRSCGFVYPVAGRHRQRYLLCRNDMIEAKYPPQPVVACAGYLPVEAPPSQSCGGG